MMNFFSFFPIKDNGPSFYLMVHVQHLRYNILGENEVDSVQSSMHESRLYTSTEREKAGFFNYNRTGSDAALLGKSCSIVC